MAKFEDVQKIINRRIGQLIAEGERAVARKYATALVNIRSILSKQYEKYEQGGELTLQDMLRNDRLKKMMKEINWMMQTHHRDVNKLMDKVLGEAYTQGYYLTAWAVESEVKTGLYYSAVRPETLTAMIANPVAGLTLNKRLEKQRKNIIYEIQNQVTQGLQKNETYGTMAKRLKGELEGDAVKSMRIVRTEGHRVQESAKIDAVKHANDNGVVMHKEWNSLEDSRVRKNPKSKADHKKLNGKKIPTDEKFDDGLSAGLAPGQLGAAGSDINCRCFLTYSIEKIIKKDPELLESVTFKKWEKERLQAS